MTRDQIVKEFWKKAKNPKFQTGQHYTNAVHHIIDLMQREEVRTMFVPEKAKEREVKLMFDREGCTVTIEGIKVVSFRGDEVILHKYVSSEVTGLRVSREGIALVRVES